MERDKRIFYSGALMSAGIMIMLFAFAEGTIICNRNIKLLTVAAIIGGIIFTIGFILAPEGLEI